MTALSSVLETEKYRIIRELGRGGMGVVYLAEDARLKREVALKVLYEHLNKQSSFAERFQEEARSVSTLHHPNIVCVHGLEVEGNTVAIDMEFVEGQSLDQLSASARISPHMAVSIARDVLSGLVACHQIGIVHRDIKPSNILVALDGTAKLTDFGLATAYASHLEDTVKGNTSTGFYMGTPRYMPPQAWEGGRPEPFWDLYSFGLVLYELITGKLVFSGDNPMEIVKKQFTEPMPDLLPVTRMVSPELVEVLEAMLKSASKDATHGAMDILRDLEQTPECKELSDSNGSTTITLPPIRRVSARAGARWRRAWRRSRTVWMGAMGGIVLAGLALLAIQTWPNPSPPVSDSPPSRVLTFSDLATGSAAYVNGRLVAMGGAMEGMAEMGAWRVSLDRQGKPESILGYTDAGFWVIDAVSEIQPDTWRVSGGWARYVQPESRRMQYGTLEGRLDWQGGSDAMSVTMLCANDLSNLRSQVNLVLLLKEANKDTIPFVRNLEANDRLQTMLYTYLLSRNLAWADRIEALMPATRSGRLIAPRIEDSVTMDGRLDEPAWLKPYFHDQGRIGSAESESPARGPRLLARWTDEDVFIGVRVDERHVGSRFELAVMPSIGSGLTGAYHFHATCDAAAITQRHFYETEKERLWDEKWGFNWEMQLSESENGTDVEIRIPRLAFEGAQAPVEGTRWRLNARWYVGDRDAPEFLIGRWGDIDIRLLEHGALLEFSGVSE